MPLDEEEVVVVSGLLSLARSLDCGGGGDGNEVHINSLGRGSFERHWQVNINITIRM